MPLTTICLAIFFQILGWERAWAAEAFTIDTGIIARRLTIEGGRLQTVAFEDRLAGAIWRVDSSPEFELRLADGRVLSADDFVVKGANVQTPGAEVTFALAPKLDGGPMLRVRYWATPGAGFVRKQLLFDGEFQGTRVTVESLSAPGAGDLGGVGQPLFLANRWFAGLESPIGQHSIQSGRVDLTHFPSGVGGRSKIAVVGGAGCSDPDRPNALQESFFRYLDTYRRPARSSLQYNSWFSYRGAAMTPISLANTFKQFRENLLDPFDLKFDAFVVDDGFQNPNAIWTPNPIWDSGLADLNRTLNEQGSKLGLWLPLNGHGLNVGVLEKQGFLRATHSKACFCLVGDKYQGELRSALKKLLLDHKLSALKHDFNFLTCAANGHGHVATAEHGREANVDALLSLLEWERSIHPDVYLSLTSNIWLSPWWLGHADCLWVGGSDYSHDWTSPQKSQRDAEMTYRDEQIYQRIVVDRCQVPVSSLMTHGLIRGELEGLNYAESLEDWANYVTLYFGRGTHLHELYITPEEMPAEHWSVLGHALGWARANLATLQHTRYVGGRPTLGEVYGYAHWSNTKGIFCLRNPGLTPKRFPLTTRDRPSVQTKVDRWFAVQSYPWREKLPDLVGELEIVVPAGGVVVVELHAEPPKWLTELPLGRFTFLGTEIASDPSPALGPWRPTRLSYDKSKWSVNVSAPATVSESKVEWTLWPGDGGRFRVIQPDATRITGQAIRQAPDRWSNWKVFSTGWQPRLSQFELQGELPISPFFPQRMEFTALVSQREPIPWKTMGRIDQEEARVWLACPGDGAKTFQTPIADRLVLYRRRWRVESFAWLLLFSLPILVGTRWVLGEARKSRRPFRSMVWLVGWPSLWVVLFSVTPIGSALGRVWLELFG